VGALTVDRDARASKGDEKQKERDSEHDRNRQKILPNKAVAEPNGEFADCREQGTKTK